MADAPQVKVLLPMFDIFLELVVFILFIKVSLEVVDDVESGSSLPRFLTFSMLIEDECSILIDIIEEEFVSMDRCDTP